MGTIRIYIKLVNGKLEYRDTETHKGVTIETMVDPGDKIIWKLDRCSGISEIKEIQIPGGAGFFKKGPIKKDFDRVKAIVADDATGEVSYHVDYTACDSNTDPKLVISADSPQAVRSDEPPRLKIKE